PLVCLLALESVALENEVPPKELGVAEPGRGPVDVLCGIDGSEQALAAVESAVRLLGERIGRLAIVTALTYDAASSGLPESQTAEARARLAIAAARALAQGYEGEPSRVVLGGPPAEALPAYAVEHGYDL